MGFDLYGLSPEESVVPDEPDFANDEEGAKAFFTWQHNTEGAYFRNNVWWWTPLWNFICCVCDDILTKEDIENGMYNDGHQIDETKAKEIAARIKKIDKDLEDHQIGHERFISNIPDEECDICAGTGKRLSAPRVGAGKMHCNGCDGNGKRRPFESRYPFTANNVREFGKFCNRSGGFKIC